MVEGPQRRLAAILAADVVGYSRLMELDEAGTLAALKGRRRQVLEPLVAKHQGRVFKVAGDGALVEFASAVNAVQCAIELQHGMASANGDLPSGRRILLRIGINLGDLIVEGGDRYGEGVNIASRLESIAQPGDILVSGTIYDQARNKIGAEFEEYAPQTLKNMLEPVRVYRVGGTPRESIPTTERATGKPSIAVLPFVNMSGDPEQEYFADGITEDIITELSRYRSLCVIARNSSFVYKNRSLNVCVIGRDLGVQYVLEGSVRRLGERIRVTAQLVDTSTGNHLWAERYDRSVEDIFVVQDEITRTIVASLPAHIEEAERTRALRRATESISAYEHWLRGRHLLNGARSKEQVLHARQHFEKAIEIDPSYAAAHVDLAQTYFAEYQSPWTASRETAAEQVLTLGRKAVELDPRDSRTHLELAWAYLHVKGDFELAKVQVDEAFALNPNDYYNYCFGGWLATCSGDLDRALDCSIEALRRSPIVSDGCLHTCVAARYLAKNYEESILAFGKMVRPDRNVFGWIAAAYGQLGRAEEALGMITEFRKRVQDLPWTPKGNQPTDWQHYWAVEFCTKDIAAREHLFDGLRKAGLPI